MRRIVNVFVVALAACSDAPTPPVTPLDHVAVCAPGRAYMPCTHALGAVHGRGAVLPANDLVDMSVLVVHLAEDGAPLSVSNTIAMRHLMQFRDGYGTVRARVMDLMRQELGAPTNDGVPPIADVMVHTGDFWIVEDGTWILSEQTLLWYSKAFRDDGGSWIHRREPAPRSASVWLKVGRLLVTY